MTGLEIKAGANPHREEAEVLIGLKRYREALGACSRAIANDPEEAANYTTLAHIHIHLEQNQEALEAARQIISLAPDWPHGYYVMSICLHNCLDFDGELRAAEHAVSLDPEDPTLLDRLARAQMQSGLLKRAKTTATQLIQISPEDADTHSLLSDICFELNDFSSAENHLLAALGQRPEDHILHNDLGRIHMARKEWRSSMTSFYNAAKLNPAEATYQNNLNLAISYWLDKQILPGKKSQALNTLEPEIRAFYQHKQDRRTPFERLGIFGPILTICILLALLTYLFNTFI